MAERMIVQMRWRFKNNVLNTIHNLIVFTLLHQCQKLFIIIRLYFTFGELGLLLLFGFLSFSYRDKLLVNGRSPRCDF